MYNHFARPLGLDGMVGSNFLTVELDRTRLAGTLERHDNATHLLLWQDRCRAWWVENVLAHIIFASVLAIILWAVFGFDLSAMVFLVAVFALSRLLAWRRYRQFDNTSLNAAEAARIIAHLVRATSLAASQSEYDRNDSGTGPVEGRS